MILLSTLNCIFSFVLENILAYNRKHCVGLSQLGVVVNDYEKEPIEIGDRWKNPWKLLSKRSTTF